MNYKIFFSIAIVLVMNGCSKDKTVIEYLFQRDGNLQIEKVSNIVKRYSLSDEYMREHNTTYEIGFPVALIDKKVKGDGAYPQYIFMNVDLCKNKRIINKDITSKFEEKPLGQNSKFVFYFSLEKMKKKKLLSNDSNFQEDVCMYTHSEIRTSLNEYIIIKSNTIRFDADEINAARAEYERLTQ